MREMNSSRQVTDNVATMDGIPFQLQPLQKALRAPDHGLCSLGMRDLIRR